MRDPMISLSRGTDWPFSSWNQHADIIAVEQDLGKLCVVSGVVEFRHVLQHHVDVVVKAQEGAAELLIALHDDPYPRSDTLVDEFEG